MTNYVVARDVFAPRAMAAVRARMPVRRIPELFVGYLDKVYAAGNRGIAKLDGRVGKCTATGARTKAPRTDVYYLLETASNT